MRNTTLSAIAAASILLLGTPAAANLGTDAAEEYAYSDSAHPTDPDSPTHTFTSIASTGSAGPSGDDNVTTGVPLGFDFEFYGTVYSTVNISTNGFISFVSTGTGCCSGQTIPTAGGIDGFIAGNWTDLTASSNIYYETQGVAPSRRFIVEYNTVRYLSSGGTVTFQIVLHEGSDEIYIHSEADGDGTRTATIGMENPTGTDGIEIFYGNTSTVDYSGVTIVFWPLREAPRLGVVTDPLEIDEGGTLDLEVTATDRQGDPVTIEWDTDLDGEHDDGTGETITVSAAGLDGPTTLEIGVRASDPGGNEDVRVIPIPVVNVPPRLSGEPEVTDILIGEEWIFVPEVTDPGGDEVDIEIVGRPPGSVLLPSGGVRWTPTEDDVGEHTLVFIATDDDDDPEVEGDGDATIEITITVSENLPPSLPTIVSPGRGEELDEVRPTLVINNPTDPEDDPLQVHFEVSTSDTFTAPIASEGQSPGTDGTTSWTVPEDLQDGVRYHWRAWATDGRNVGPRVSSFFFVELRGGDGGPTDGGPDADADSGPTGPVAEPGCACRSGGGAGSGAAGLVLVLLALSFVLRRR